MREARRPVTFLCLLVALVVVPALSAQETIGRIVRIDGSAQIDAFGRDRFIDAREGDLLYEASIVRAGPNGWVSVEIDGVRYEIAPATTARATSFRSASRRGGEPTLFRRLLQSLVDAFAPPEEQVADFGGRARGPDDRWAEPVDAVDLEYEAAQGALAAGDYRAAVEHLSRIDDPSFGNFPLVEYHVALARALLGTGNVDASLGASFDFAAAVPGVDAVGLLPARLQMLAAIAAFYAGDDDIARAASGAYLEAVGTANAEPIPLAIRIVTLEETDPRRASSLERDARGAHPDVEWDVLLGR